MTQAALKFISDKLDALNISYQFGEWTTDPVPNPYFIGEYSESDFSSEDGSVITDFILTGTGTTFLALETAKNTIFENINDTAILSNGNGIAISYSGALTVPTGDMTLKRIQINLTIKEWSVAI